MKVGLAVLLLCLAVSASGRERPGPSPYEPRESNGTVDEAAPTHVLPVVRATQINRCPDARGKIVLQDLPCGPEVARSASAPEAAADIVDLAHLEKRPLPETPVREARDPDNRFTQGLVSGAWKFGAAAGGLRRNLLGSSVPSAATSATGSCRPSSRRRASATRERRAGRAAADGEPARPLGPRHVAACRRQSVG